MEDVLIGAGVAALIYLALVIRMPVPRDGVPPSLPPRWDSSISVGPLDRAEAERIAAMFEAVARVRLDLLMSLGVPARLMVATSRGWVEVTTPGDDSPEAVKAAAELAERMRSHM